MLVSKFVRFPVRNPVRNRSEKHGLSASLRGFL